MNNLVKQQGCAGSGVTSFTPHWQAFLLSKRGGSRNQNLSPLKRRPHITYLCSPVCLSCPPLPRATEFPFLLLFNHLTTLYFPCEWSSRSWWMQSSPPRQSGTACSISHFISFLNARHKKRKKKTKPVLQKGVTRQADYKEMGDCVVPWYPPFSNCNVIPSAQTPKGCKYVVPERLVYAPLRDCDFTLQWWESASSHHKKKKQKQHTKVAVFPQNKWLSCSVPFFFLFFSSEQEFVAEWKPIAHLFPETQFSPKWTLSSTNEALFEELQSTAASPAETGILDSMLREPLMCLKGLLWDHHWQLRSKVGLPHPEEADSRCF